MYRLAKYIEYVLWGPFIRMNFPIRRVEDKLDAKSLTNELVQIRCDVAPSAKKVKISYGAWIIFEGGCEDSNIWYNCQLMADRSLKF